MSRPASLDRNKSEDKTGARLHQLQMPTPHAKKLLPSKGPGKEAVQPAVYVEGPATEAPPPNPQRPEASPPAEARQAGRKGMRLQGAYAEPRPLHPVQTPPGGGGLPQDLQRPAPAAA